jgi:N-acylneuraminate cytidylyltransferase
MGIKFEIACCILPTAPLIKYENILKAFEILKKENLDSVITVTEYNYPIQRSLRVINNKVYMNWPENINIRSQDLEKMYHDAGQFYIFKVTELKKQKKLFMENTGAIILNNLEVQDIDTEIDWKLAEMKFKLIFQAGELC